MTRRRNQKPRSQKIEDEEEESAFGKVLHIAGVRAARSIAGSLYSISSEELNIAAHVSVYRALLSVFCKGDTDFTHLFSHLLQGSIWTYCLNMRIQESITAPFLEYYKQYGTFTSSDLDAVGKDLARFASISFRIQGGFIDEYHSLFDNKLYDAISNVFRQFLHMNVIPEHTPLRILDPCAGTHAGLCLYLLCQYKLDAHINSRWSITAIDSDPVALGSSICMLLLCKEIWNQDLEVSLTAQRGTFLFSKEQKAQVGEILMHHPKKERHIRDIIPVEGDTLCIQNDPFDLLVMAPREACRHYPSEVFRYLESVYVTGICEYMQIEAVCRVPARLRVIVQQERWLTKECAEGYRAWIQDVCPTDIFAGEQGTVYLLRDEQEQQNHEKLERKTTTVHRKGMLPFQICWSELDPTEGWKLQDPRVATLIQHLSHIGQPLSRYLLGEKPDTEDDYLNAILESYTMRWLIAMQKQQEQIPILVPDPYNPKEQDLEKRIRQLYLKKRELQERKISGDQLLQAEMLLERQIWILYLIPTALQPVIMQYAGWGYKKEEEDEQQE